MASLAASLFALGPFASPATAQTHGTFQTTYSGGSVTASLQSTSGGPATCSNTPQISQFSAGGGQYTGSASVSASSDSGGGTNQCSAQIAQSPLTAAFAWHPDPSNPNEPAPSSAILTQTCSASWSFSKDSASSASGSGPSNGLSNGVVTPPGSDPNSQASTSSSTLYSMWSGSSGSSAPPSLSCSPSAGVSGTSGPGYSHAGLSGSVTATYSAVATPIFINIGGTTLVNGTQEVLSGQPITVSLSTLPSGCSASNYQWDIESANGGSLCGGYIAEQAEGMTTPPSPSLQSPSVTFYDGSQDTVTVNLTATITFSDKTTGTAKVTATVGVVKPSVTSHTFTISEYDTFAQDPNNYGPILGALEQWGGVVISMPPGFSGGNGCFAQMLNSTLEDDTRHTGSDYTVQEKLSNGQWVAIPTPCLDTNFPYPFSNEWTVGASGSSGQDQGIDSPYFPVSPSLASGDLSGVADWYKASGSSKFQTWIMYNPNAQSSSDIWVPLSNFDWNWGNTAMLNTSSQMWQSGAFTSDNGSDIAPTGVWPLWQTWIPYTRINNANTGTVEMHY